MYYTLGFYHYSCLMDAELPSDSEYSLEDRTLDFYLSEKNSQVEDWHGEYLLAYGCLDSGLL